MFQSKKEILRHYTKLRVGAENAIFLIRKNLLWPFDCDLGLAFRTHDFLYAKFCTGPLKDIVLKTNYRTRFYNN